MVPERLDLPLERPLGRIVAVHQPHLARRPAHTANEADQIALAGLILARA